MLAARKNPKRRATRLRDPERTRERLLQAASREIYRSGFQSASLDTILAAAGVTKGALYYHFDSKEALGYAVVEEIIAPDVRGKWVRPLQSGKDPIDALIGIVQRISVRPEDVRGGCQLNNLAQEMSPLDAGFRKRLATIFDAWREAVASVLREGQTHGSVRRDVEPADAAGLLIAMVEGYGSLAKNAQDPKVMKAGIRNIVDWLTIPASRRATASEADRIGCGKEQLTVTYQPVRMLSQRIGRSASNYIMKRRTNNDKDRSVAQESARNGSLRAGWCREPAGTGKCQRIGRAELNERGDRPEVVRRLGEERLGPTGYPARR